MSLMKRLFANLAVQEEQRDSALSGGELTGDMESQVRRYRIAHDARENAGSLRETFEEDLRSFQQDVPHAAPLSEPKDP